MSEHRGWHSRGYLPHRDEPGLIQAITFHLADSVPLQRSHSIQPPTDDADTHHIKVQRWLDEGTGGCLLAIPRVADIVENILLDRDDTHYGLLAWVVMPNHVHVVVDMQDSVPLERVIHGWKGYSARRIDDLLSRRGALWHHDYYDRYIRDAEHLEKAVLYVHGNPVRAGLVDDPGEWPFGSARRLPTADSLWHVPRAAPW